MHAAYDYSKNLPIERYYREAPQLCIGEALTRSSASASPRSCSPITQVCSCAGHEAHGTLVMQFKRTMLISERGLGIVGNIRAAKSVAA